MLSMNMAYDFLVPQRIVFGWGRRTELPSLLSSYGHRIFLIAGSRTLERQGKLQQIADSLESSRLKVISCGFQTREPEVEDVDRLVQFLRDQRPGHGDLILAIGGGSAIDLAKAASAVVTNPQGSSVMDFLEGVGTGAKITHQPLPVIAMPTTSGTGSEATKNAVISSYEPVFKKSLRSDLMIPRLVVLDPELTVSAPLEVTAATGLDALTQLIESYISCRAKPLPQALSLRGVEGVSHALRKVAADPENRPARELLAQSALLSGMALANSGLGIAHGIAAALGVHCRVTHGLACAMLLPTAIHVNREVRAAELGRILSTFTGRHWTTPRAAIEDGLDELQQLLQTLRIPARLSALGVQKEQIPAIVRSSHGNSLDGNPRPVSDDELTSILESLL